MFGLMGVAGRDRRCPTNMMVDVADFTRQGADRLGVPPAEPADRGQVTLPRGDPPPPDRTTPFPPFAYIPRGGNDGRGHDTVGRFA